MGLLRVLGILVLTLAALYAAIVVLALSFKDKLTFIPLKQLLLVNTSTEQPPEDVFVQNSFGQRLHGWFFDTPGAQSCTLVCHGNGANLSYYAALVNLFKKLRTSVLIFDYPGFGQSEGRPTEASAYESGLLFFDALVKRGFAPENIVIAGMSLGGAVATRIARERPKYQALVLIATFVSPRRLLWTLFKPLVLLAFVANEFFLNEDLKLVTGAEPGGRSRTVVMHSRTDGLIDFSHAEENAKTARCRLLEIDGWHGDPRFSDKTVAELASLITI